MNALSPTSFAKTIVDLSRDECRWAVTRRSPHRFCAAPTISGKSYCAHHDKASRLTNICAHPETMGGRQAGSYVSAIMIPPQPRRIGRVALLKRKAATELTLDDLPSAFVADPVGYVTRRAKPPQAPKVRVQIARSTPAMPAVEDNSPPQPVVIPWIVKQIDGHDPVTSSEAAASTGVGAASRVTIRSIIATVAEHYGVTSAEIRGPRKTHRIVLPRQIAMWIAYERGARIWSLPVVGRAFGGRDHTTALHAVQKIGRMVADGSVVIPEHLMALSRPQGDE